MPYFPPASAAPAWTLIGTQTPNGVASVLFTGIPQNFQDLLIYAGVNFASGAAMGIQLSNDAVTYTGTVLNSGNNTSINQALIIPGFKLPKGLVLSSPSATTVINTIGATANNGTAATNGTWWCVPGGITALAIVAGQNFVTPSSISLYGK